MPCHEMALYIVPRQTCERVMLYLQCLVAYVMMAIRPRPRRLHLKMTELPSILGDTITGETMKITGVRS